MSQKVVPSHQHTNVSSGFAKQGHTSHPNRCGNSSHRTRHVLRSQGNAMSAQTTTPVSNPTILRTSSYRIYLKYFIIYVQLRTSEHKSKTKYHNNLVRKRKDKNSNECGEQN